MNAIYLSTGAFTEKKNGRNPRLLSEYHSLFDCDGFELMIFPNFYDNLKGLVAEYRALGIKIPVIHADKAIGDLLCSPEPEKFVRAKELFYINCDAAAELGARKIVVHCWGVPNSDAFPELIYERTGRLLEIAKVYGLDALPENLVCQNKTPLSHLEATAMKYPGVGFTLDTRCAQFHRELEATLESPVFTENIRHIHITDSRCGLKDWDNLYPILQPGRGNIDWANFFRALKARAYSGSVTLEAPSVLETGVDAETLNESLDFIRHGLNNK